MKRTKAQYEKSLPIYSSDRRIMREELNFINFNINKSCRNKTVKTDK